MKILKYIFKIWGFSSLIFLPYIQGFKPADIFTILTFIVVLFFFLLEIAGKQLVFKISIIILYLLTVLYFITTIVGAFLNAPNSFEKSLLVTFRYFLVVTTIFMVFTILNFEIHKIKSFFLYFSEGFIFSGIFNGLWIIIDQVFYYIITPFYSVNEIVFSNINIGLDHELTNRFAFHDFLLLRSAGLGWDPGGLGPALLVCYLLSDILGKGKKIKLFLLIAILLTLSRTTYAVLIIYFMIRFLKYVSKLNENYLFVGAIFIFFVINLVILPFISVTYLGLYFEEGTVRHIKYFSELYNLVYASLPEIIFGYGYRGTGEFFDKYVPWLYEFHGFEFSDFSVAESTLSNLFLYGGIIGSIYNLYLYFSLLVKEKIYKSVVYTLIFLYFGYTFENIWSFFLIYYLWFSNFIGNRNMS